MRAFLVSSSCPNAGITIEAHLIAFSAEVVLSTPIKKAEKVKQRGFRAVFSLHTMLLSSWLLRNRAVERLCVFCPLALSGFMLSNRRVGLSLRRIDRWQRNVFLIFLQNIVLKVPA